LGGILGSSSPDGWPFAAECGSKSRSLQRALGLGNMKLLSFLLLVGIAVLGAFFFAGREGGATPRPAIDVAAQVLDSESESEALRPAVSEPEPSIAPPDEAVPQHAVRVVYPFRLER
jgi:hypothetical protein